LHFQASNVATIYSVSAMIEFPKVFQVGCNYVNRITFYWNHMTYDFLARYANSEAFQNTNKIGIKRGASSEHPFLYYPKMYLYIL